MTGATSGIGNACCRRFLAAGAKVVAIGRRAERLRLLSDEYGERVHAVELDVRDQPNVVSAFETIPSSHRAITVLVNNAGVAVGPVSLLEGDYQQWTSMVDTNIKGVLSVTAAVLPGMIARQKGHVFNVGSVAGRYPAGATVYGGTKAFVHHLSLALRRDLLGTPIRVTAIHPGLTATELRLVAPAGDVPPGGTGVLLNPSDVAEALFLCHSLPASVNVNQIELMPVMQGFGGFSTAPSERRPLPGTDRPNAND